MLAAIGEDDARQEQGDDDKDGEPEDLVDGACKGRVEVDQEDRDEKGGINPPLLSIQLGFRAISTLQNFRYATLPYSCSAFAGEFFRTALFSHNR